MGEKSSISSHFRLHLAGFKRGGSVIDLFTFLSIIFTKSQYKIEKILPDHPLKYDFIIAFDQYMSCFKHFISNSICRSFICSIVNHSLFFNFPNGTKNNGTIRLLKSLRSSINASPYEPLDLGLDCRNLLFYAHVFTFILAEDIYPHQSTDKIKANLYNVFRFSNPWARV